jgi:hypothetical protein
LRDHIAENISDAKRFRAVSLVEALDLLCINGVAGIKLTSAKSRSRVKSAAPEA